jgi:hypothetical protein
MTAVQELSQVHHPSQASEVSSLLTLPSQEPTGHATPTALSTAPAAKVSTEPAVQRGLRESGALITTMPEPAAVLAPVPCISADLFYTLEAPTLQLLFSRLRRCSTVQFLHQPQEIHPSCFAFRSKPNTTTTFSLPASLGGGMHRQWCVVGNIGRGTYGHAILMQEAAARGSSGGERRVYKVDTARDSVVWEAAVHVQVTSGATPCTSK